ncbi:phosphatidylinositol-3,5-bisphosphate 5-phosphatase, variant 2 [Homalodisca vitripennis]|nr:phosphatidylinositol-3,5-bisphosphate 5-phosphatase, variant 2 [Homalodisca vitripennis]
MEPVKENKVALGWVSGYKGISENETSDALVKINSENLLVGPEPGFGVAFSYSEALANVWPKRIRSRTRFHQGSSLEKQTVAYMFSKQYCQFKLYLLNVPGPIEHAVAEDLFASLTDEDSTSNAKSREEDSQGSSAIKSLVHFGVRGEPNRRYVWNSYLLSRVEKELHPDWILYIMHGFISQSNVSIFGRSVYIALIARRSNKYAGTRFLKRGANFDGDVANEVETEQLVEDIGISSTENPRMSSFVQMRGSIPAHWSQDISKMVPKPAITFDLSDAFAQTAEGSQMRVTTFVGALILKLEVFPYSPYSPDLVPSDYHLFPSMKTWLVTQNFDDNVELREGAHFNKLLQRYGSPIIILNLVKEREKKKHESQLSGEYLSAITYLNQFLPPDHRIQYVHFDMARMNKGKGANVMGGLADIARSAVTKTGFYTSYRSYSSQQHLTSVVGQESSDGRVQTGIIRVNCVDCLDRTNTAQFAVGKCALGYQLCSMGLLQWPALDFDSDCVRLLEVLYEDHGDTLALQYGGSQLVHRIKTYRKTAPWTSQGNDIMQTLSRYYSNTFSDTEKQHAMNLFLGLFVPDEHSSPLWEQVTDYYLHNSLLVQHRLTPQTQWWDQEVMQCLPLSVAQCHKTCKDFLKVSPLDIEFVDAYSDFHRPHEFTELNETYANKISHSVRDFMPHCVTDFSPFTVRIRPGRRREETGRGATAGKNPSLTGQSSTSSTASTDSSEESDEESLDPHHSESYHSSPAKDMTSSGLVTFDSLFPSFQQTYGQELQPPSKSDTHLYKRYVLMYRMANKAAEQPLSTGMVSPSQTQPSVRTSAFEVTPPEVSEKSVAIYSQYVERARGNVTVNTDKYQAYVNCELGVFPVVGWEN